MHGGVPSLGNYTKSSVQDGRQCVCLLKKQSLSRHITCKLDIQTKIMRSFYRKEPANTQQGSQPVRPYYFRKPYCMLKEYQSTELGLFLIRAVKSGSIPEVKVNTMKI